MAFGSLFSRPEKYSSSNSLSPAEEAASTWDERIGRAAVQAYNWRRMSLGLLIACVVLAVGLIIQSMKSTVVPYVVEVDRSTGAIKNMGVLEENTSYTPQSAEMKFFIKEFIKNTREVPLDPIVYKTNWMKGYKFLTKDAATKFSTVAQNEKVNEKFGRETVQVTVNSILQIEGSNSYHVNWSEESFSVGSGEKKTTNMVGVFTVTVIPTKDEEILRDNPLGIYISDFNFEVEKVTSANKDNKAAGQPTSQGK